MTSSESSKSQGVSSLGGEGVQGLPAAPNVPSSPRRRRWYLGIQSKKDPAHVMTEAREHDDLVMRYLASCDDIIWFYVTS